METQACAICGALDWCGRPCLRDPGRRNGLLFWPDGREKTLRERGLGFDDPPVRVSGVRKRPSKVLRAVVGVPEPVTETPVTETLRVTKTPSVTKTSEGGFRNKGGRPKKEEKLSAAERMRRMRAARRALEGGGVVGGGRGKD